MNRKLFLVLAAFLVLMIPACTKKEEPIPVPEPPPAEEAPQEEVIEEPAKPEVEVKETESIKEVDLSSLGLEDIYFDFDKSALTEEARSALNRYAQVLKANPSILVLIEGHCDERGTEEYNIGLGERRATRVQEYLTSLGVQSSRLRTISYGEMRPKVQGHDESAWSQNRRAHFTLSR